MQVLSFASLVLVVVGIWYGAALAIDGTYEEVNAPYHRITTHSLGYHDQGEVVRAKVMIDEGSVKVLEGRYATVLLLDSENKGTLELGEGYDALRTVRIDGVKTDVGEFEYEAHAGDTYYIAYLNEDWWNLTLRVADGDALGRQLIIKVYSVALTVTVFVVFAWAYGRLFDVNVRAYLGLVGRPKGPGAKAARERKSTSYEEDIIE
jgi:hypothetical protein